MPIIHQCEQYSEEYDRLKLGLPTSSNFFKILTPEGKPSKQWREFACRLIAERVLSRKIDTYASPAMERGLIVENDAADWYSLSNDIDTEKVGFITNDAGTIGCSPDRLIGDDGLLEIKAPLPHTQIEYFISGEVKIKYKPQLQGQLYISKRAWVDIICWSEELPKVVLRVEPDEDYIAKLAQELEVFNFFVERVMDKIRATNDVPIPHGRYALKEALRASLGIVP